MKIANILSSEQLLFLNLFSKEKQLNCDFYLSGGTALCEYYINYRLSEDLDFFSFLEFSPDKILVFIKKNKKQLGYNNIEFNTSFNRNLFFLKYTNQTLKLEFTYYPFVQIEKPKKINNILIDNLIDIAVNKLFTIYQKPRARDFIDLYMICSQENYLISDLVKKARLKFDTYIDPIKLGTQFMLCKEVKDYPKLLIKLENKKWQKFFLDEALKLSKQILE